jgi:hypothetical protein
VRSLALRAMAEYARQAPGCSALPGAVADTAKGRFFKNANLGEGNSAAMSFQGQNDAVAAGD